MCHLRVSFAWLLLTIECRAKFGLATKMQSGADSNRRLSDKPAISFPKRRVAWHGPIRKRWHVEGSRPSVIAARSAGASTLSEAARKRPGRRDTSPLAFASTRDCDWAALSSRLKKWWRPDDESVILEASPVLHDEWLPPMVDW